MKANSILLLLAFTLFISSCDESRINAQSKQVSNEKVGGRCEGCEAIYESPIPFEKLSWIDTLPDFHEKGPKLEISGTIFQSDGKTPAKDVILYIYHTDQAGNYSTKGNETGWGKRHGYIRGWVKTNSKGQYKFYTLRPAAYPNRRDPQHIHPVIKEPGVNEYWIDEFLFADDPLLPKEEKIRKPKGGNGVLTVTSENGILKAKRDIILGLNVENYKTSFSSGLKSGLAVGSNCPAFDPIHMSGPDKVKALVQCVNTEEARAS